VTPGRWRDSPKRQREERERVERYRAHMAAGQANIARERKKAERRLNAELSNVVPFPGGRPANSPAPSRVDVVTSDVVTALVDLLRAPGGISYAEAASRLNLQPKGDKPHHAPAAQVRALVRDKVRKLHPVVTIARDPARGGAVYRLQ
jgi:hypothetical protein